MIKKNKILALYLWAFFAISKIFASTDPWSGNILLMSLPCYLCRMIEGEQQLLPYSHVALQLYSPINHRPYWIEAWGTQGVTLHSEPDFFASLKQRRANLTQAHWGLFKAPLALVPYQKQWQAALWKQAQLLVGKSYDPAFLWYNQGSNGDESYYCSELVAKLLNLSLEQLYRDKKIHPAQFKTLTLKPKPMSYQHFWNQWVKYFAPQPVPQGQPGLTPEDIALATFYNY